MPNVPIYNAPTVAPTETPGVRQQTPYRMMQTADIGPGQIEALGHAGLEAGKTAVNIMTEEQIQANEAAVKDYDAKLMGAVQGVLYGTDDNPDSGYLSQKGGQAVDGRKAALDKLQQLPQDLSDGLTNSAQQRMAKNAAQIRIQSAMAEVNRHHAQQLQVYQDAAGQTRMKVAQDGAAKAYDPLTDSPNLSFDHDAPGANSSYQTYLQTVKSEATDLAARRGYDPDTAKAFVDAQMQQAYMGTMSFLLQGKKGGAAESGDLAAAKSFFEKVKDQLTPEQQEKVNAVLTSGTQQDNIVTVTRALQAMPGGFDAKKKALGDAFDGKGRIGGVSVNGTIYEHALSALERDKAQAQANEAKWEASAVGQAQDFFLRNPGKGVMDLPRNLYVALEAKGHLAALDAFANREGKVQTDPVAWFNTQTHLGDGSDRDVAKMSDADWMLMRNHMSDADWKHWSIERDRVRNGEVAPKNDPGNLHVAGFNAALNNRLLSIGVDPKAAKSETDKERIGAVQQFATQWVIADQQAAGRRFNQDEMQKSLDRLFATNVQFRNTFLGFSTGVSTQRMMSMKASDIPRDAYDGIKKDLISAGNANPTDRDILMQYWSMHRGK